MRRLLRILFLTTAALGAAVVAYVFLSLPPAPRRLDVAIPSTIVFGAYHLHSSRSDGGGTVEDIAAAAARAGLAFVILTDHGDATRVPDPPQYRHGVLCLDAVEISTTDGHLVALGMNGAAPYPLGGEARDVVEDVHRLGGWAIAAHPDSPKVDQRWRAARVPIDGLEWLNADSEWRDKRPLQLLRAVGHYFVRPAAAIAAVFDRPEASLRRWDVASRQRPTAGLAAVDAHARIGWDERSEPRTAHTLLARPTYEDMFRTVVQAVRLDRPWTGDGAADAAALLHALARRHTYSAIVAQAAPAVIEFNATDGTHTHESGDELETTSGPVVFEASVAAPSNAMLVILRDGNEVASGYGRAHYETTSPGVYRAEARLAGAAAPWITTNPIVVGRRPSASPVEVTAGARRLEALSIPSRWAFEKNDTSTASVLVEGGEVQLTYHLAPGRKSGQYAALVHPLPGVGSFDRIAFTIRSDRPTRVSVQVRLPGPGDGERWIRSVYVDHTPRAVVLQLQEFEPVGVVTSRRPIVARIQSLLFVADAPNTPPGAQGSLWVSRVALSAPMTLDATSGR